MFGALGHTLGKTTRILDFGCGSGELVRAAYEAGLDAYGCDIDFSSEWVDHETLAELRATNRVRQIDRASPGKVSPGSEEIYHLPFDDETFDVVISDQVFEHVRNYREALDEIARVTKPDAVMLHFFPARYTPIEPHIFVPLAGFFHPRWWLLLWALLGVRNQYQHGLTAAQTVASNENFLRDMVNYLTMKQIRREFERHFSLLNAEGNFMRLSKRAKMFLTPGLYRTFRAHCLFAQRHLQRPTRSLQARSLQ